MKSKIALFLFSFLLGLYLWFPYRTVYKGLLDNYSTKLPVVIEYTLADASLTGVVLKEINLKYHGLTIKENNLYLKLNPFALVVSRDLLAIKRKGLFIKIGYNAPDYYVEGVLDRYKDPNLGNTILNGRFSMVIDEKTGFLKDGAVDITADNLKIKASSMAMDFKRVIFKCHIRDGVVEIRRLTAHGGIDAQITGRLVQDTKNINNSKLDINIRYQIGGKNFSTRLSMRLGQLLAQSSLLRP